MANLDLRVWKGHEGETGQLVCYEVPYTEGMSLLDAIFWIREHADPELAVRYSCRVSNACKECSASINGKPGYLCNTKAQPGVVTELRPLPKMPWIKDLVTRME